MAKRLTANRTKAVAPRRKAEAEAPARTAKPRKAKAASGPRATAPRAAHVAILAPAESSQDVDAAPPLAAPTGPTPTIPAPTVPLPLPPTHAPTSQPAQGATMPRAASRWSQQQTATAWALAGGLALAGVGVWLAATNAHDHLDRAAPDKAGALRALALMLAAGLAAFGASWALLRRDATVPLASAGGASVVLGLVLASFFSDYGFLGDLGVLLTGLYLGIPLLLAMVVLGVVQAVRPAPGLAQGAIGVALAWLGGWALAAAYLLVNIDAEVAEAARENNRHAPGLALLACILVLAGMAWRRRRLA